MIPDVDGGDGWTPPPRRHARIVARLRERGHSLELIREASKQGRLAYGFVEELFPTDREAHGARRGRRGDGPRARPHRALHREHRPPGADARAHDRRGRARAPVRGRRARRGLPARRLPPALPRLRPGAVADRGRRGAPVPHLRARAADARGRARARDGRGDGAPRARPAAAGLAAHGLRAPALPAPLPRAGRGRPHGDGARRPGARPAAGGDRLRGPGRLHALHRGGGRGGGAVLRRAVRRGGQRTRSRRTPA